MANPPRPWLRLSSIRAVVPASAPAPAPQPTQPPPPPPPQEPPPRFAPDARTSASSSPSQKVPPTPSSSSVPGSPLQKATITNSSTVHSSPASRKDSSASSSPRSPRTIKQAVQSPKQSPKFKTSVPPPSPLILPPSSLKTEPNITAEAEAVPKTVLVEMTVDKPRQWPNGSGDFHRERETGESRNNGSSRHGKLVAEKECEGNEKGAHKKFSDSEDSGMRVITIAGENRGAYMELIQSQKKNLHKNGISKETNDGGESESSVSGEGNKKDRNNRGRRVSSSSSSSSSFPMAAYMNSNVQCVNNSLLFHASCSHHDPGVRLYLSKKPFGEGYHFKERVEGQDV